MKKKTKSMKEFEEMARKVSLGIVLESIYEKEKNPYAPWLAYKVHRELGGEIPEWILAYFENCSKKMDNLDSHSSKDDLLKALKFAKPSGERSFATEMKQVLKYLPATVECYMLSKTGDRKNPALKRMVDIFSTVAEKNNLNDEIVHKYYYKYRSIVPSLLKPNTMTRALAPKNLRKRYPSMVRS
tara:strand:- start:1049 stop:1603 length:555 start_codon:yes stop_codon:yes gene_type:complete